MDSNGSLILPLNGLDNGRIELPNTKSWHPGTFIFRVWWDGPTVVKQHPQAGFLAHDTRLRSFTSETELHEAVAAHVNNETLSSRLISTSLSLFWALAHAQKVRASGQTEGYDIKISIIKASELDPATIIVARHCLPQFYQDCDMSTLRTYADQSQEVLVYHQIPDNAILRTFIYRTYEYGSDHAYGTELRWAKELPWLAFDDSSSMKAKDLARQWENVFTQSENKRMRKMHGERCLRLALRLLKGYNDCELRDQVLALAIYLYRWPGSQTRAPSWDFCAELIRRRWNVLQVRRWNK
jgi:hypothetical protein